MPMLPDQWLTLNAYERDVLHAIVRNPGSTTRRLHSRVSTDDVRTNYHSITTRPLDSLEERGLIQRAVHARDERMYEWRPTREGRRLMDEVREVWQ